jgi:signal peptidase I
MVCPTGQPNGSPRTSIMTDSVGMQQNDTPGISPPAEPAAALPAQSVTPAPLTPVPPTPVPRSTLWSALSWVRDLAFSVLIAVILIVFIYQPVKVEGTSMMPTLTDQERIFINKFTYHFGLGDIQRGDMVVFWFPLDPSKSYIKRVIGIPGDRIQIDGGQVYVNDRTLAEDYVPSEFRVTWCRTASTSFWAITAVPQATAGRGVS